MGERKFMQNPVIHGGYTEQDLREYARYRKDSELEGIKDLLEDNKISEGIISPSEHDEYREPLSFTKEIVIDILLSTGGDADGFKLVFDQDKQLIKGYYYWSDWGVYEEVRLTQNELDWVDCLYMASEWLNC